MFSSEAIVQPNTQKPFELMMLVDDSYCFQFTLKHSLLKFHVTIGATDCQSQLRSKRQEVVRGADNSGPPAGNRRCRDRSMTENQQNNTN